MLVKPHVTDFLEDFGLLTKNGQVYLYENGLVKRKPSYNWSAVVQVNAIWVDKDIKIKCQIADTSEKKRIGLSKHDDLAEYEGMLFPFPGPQTVNFHQGGVPFSMDVLFFNDSEIVHFEQLTNPYENSHWSCDNCEMVLEVNGGFCAFNDIQKGDKVAFFAMSEQDLKDFETEKATAHFLTFLSYITE